MARLDVGEVYAASFRLAFRNFAAFLRTQGVIAIALAVVSLLFGLFVLQVGLADIYAIALEKPTPDAGRLVAVLAPIVAGAFAVAIVSFLVAPASYGIGLRVADVVSAGPSGITLAEAWAGAKPRYGALMGLLLLFFGGILLASILFAIMAVVLAAISPVLVLLAVLAGIAACVVFVWLVLRWFPAPAIVFFEGARPMDSLRRAAQLTQGSRGAILGLVVLLILTFAIPSAIVGSLFAPSPAFDPNVAPSDALRAMQPSPLQQIGSWIVSTAFSVVGGFVGVCVMLLVYRRLAQPETAEPAMGPITLAPPPPPPGA